VHRRLVPGFVIDARIDGEDRIVTFFNGSVVRELLVDRDDEARRLVWSAVDGRADGTGLRRGEGDPRTADRSTALGP
jgi:hypothetical protein